MAVAGLRGTGNYETDERPKNFREMILWRDPNGSAPLTALMSKMKKETVDDPQYHWWEEELKAIRLTTGTAATTTAQAVITVLTTGDFDATDAVVGDTFLVEENPAAGSYGFEIVEVSTATTTAATLNVTRGASGTAGNTGTIASGSSLLKIGTAFEEGSAAPAATTRNPTKYYNYTQIFKHVYNMTGTNAATKIRTGDPLKNDKKRRMFDHAVAMEQAFMFGFRNETTGGAGLPKRYTGGLYQFLADAYDATTKPTIKVWTTTAVTEDDILDATTGMWDYNVPESGTERIALAGNGFLNYLNKIANNSSSSRINFDGVIDVFGMKLQRWILPQGTIYFRTAPLMNTNSRFSNGCFIINPPGVRYRPLQGRDTKFQDNIQTPGDDAKKGQWITEAGVEFHHLGSMRYLGIHV